MIGPGSPSDNSETPSTSISKSDKHQEDSKLTNSSLNSLEDISNSESRVGADGAKMRVLEEDDEDESHLPPGVRRQNRCHSSSSSEDEGKKKNASDSATSEDDSDTPKRGTAEKGTDGSSKAGSKDKEKGHADDKKRTRDSSRSRSRSRSPSRSKRRSSERSRHSRSRSRDRHHRRDRRRRSHRSGSRERRRSRDKDRRRQRRDHHRRSRSRSRSRSHSRDKRDRRKDRRSSRDRDRRTRRYRSPSPRGGNVIKYGDKVIKPGASFGRPPPSKPMTFKEKMRQQLIKVIEEGGDVSTALTNKDGTALCTQTAGTQQQLPAPKKPPVPLMSTIVTSTAGLSPMAMTITASEAAMQSMLALQKETTEKTGVEIPKYYNPAAINPVKYAEQVQKRKLLWSKNKEKDVNSQWNTTGLSSDHDDKSKEKFRKLMGIKPDTIEGSDDSESKVLEDQKQKQLFDHLDKEYQYARMATHTHRGIGLGFGSANYQPPSSTGS